MMKKVLFLGGFPQMIDIVQEAKKMGIYTIVVDRDLNSPAKKYADRAEHISTDQLDALEALCKNERIDGVFTGFEDFNIHIARSLCDRLGLPFYATKEQLDIVTNKDLFKEMCRRYGVPVIEQYTLQKALKEGKYPYIVKPVDSYGSRGITVCYDGITLEKGYKKAVNTSRSGKAIIERFIDSEYGVELFYTIIEGKIHRTVTADRYTVTGNQENVPLPIAEVFPSRHAQEMNTLDSTIRKMLTGMGLRDGLVLVQSLYEQGEFFVYEMAFRFTGEQHYLLVKAQNDVSLARMMIQRCLGENISAFDTPLLDDKCFIKPAINYAMPLRPGVIAKIEGLDRLSKIDGIINYGITHFEKDKIESSADYSCMLLRVNIVAENQAKLRDAIEELNNNIKVTSENGGDMLLARFRLPKD